MTLLRAYLVIAAVLAPATVAPARAVHDWTPRILAPSPWDWLPEAAFLPSLGVHKEALRRGP